jgi:RNA polymerase sigma-70 factor (ECF subfamily)
MNEAFVTGPWPMAPEVTAAEPRKCQSAGPDASLEATSALTRADEISQLFREHNRALIKFVLTLVGNEQEARDVAQEAYVRLLQLERPVAVAYLRWYLFKIARNIAADHYRRARVRARRADLDVIDGVDSSSPTEAGAIAADQLSMLSSAMEELSGNCRKAFFLHNLCGLSTVEVAERMQITDRMVRNHLRKALLYCRFRCDGLTSEEARHLAER